MTGKDTCYSRWIEPNESEGNVFSQVLTYALFAGCPMDIARNTKTA